jgi:hypothetical protein
MIGINNELRKVIDARAKERRVITIRCGLKVVKEPVTNLAHGNIRERPLKIIEMPV